MSVLKPYLLVSSRWREFKNSNSGELAGWLVITLGVVAIAVAALVLFRAAVTDAANCFDFTGEIDPACDTST